MTNLFPPETVDSIDYDKRYMEKVIEFDWWKPKWDNYHTWFHNEAMPYLESLNPQGTMIFAGVYDGFDYALIKDKFDLEVIGIDIVNYSPYDIIVADVREYLKTLNKEITYFWNGIGPWPWNRESKKACFDYAKKYFVSGGYYIDHVHTSKDAPNVMNDKDFKVLDDNFFIMRKI